MAYQLFVDIDDFQKYVGGAANNSIELASLEPYMKVVAEEHIIPLLGRELYNQLVGFVESDEGTTNQKLLISFAAAPLAYLTLHDYIDVGTVQLSQGGMMRMETESAKSAYKYQEANYRERMKHNGYQSLEVLQVWLSANGDHTDFNLWTSAGKKLARGLVINTAGDLARVYSKQVSRYTFEMLRALILDIELFALVPSIGRPMYDDLKDKILNDNLTDKLNEMLEIVQRVVGNFVIEEGVRRHWVQIDGPAVVQKVQRSIDAREQRIPAPEGHAASLKINQAEQFANRWLSWLSVWLDDNIDHADLALYKTWKQEQEAAEQTASQAEETDYYTSNESTGGVVLL
ncbi:MAG: DUF6712 family protein [Bacteroidota bacterium]